MGANFFPLLFEDIFFLSVTNEPSNILFHGFMERWSIGYEMIGEPANIASL